MKLKIFQLLLLTLAQNLAAQENCGIVDEQFLYNSKNTTSSGELPWLAVITGRNDNNTAARQLICQAVIVSKNTVATSHHCVVSNAFNFLEVIIGDWIGTKKYNCVEADDPECVPLSSIYTVDEIILNPAYNKQKKSADIALLLLDRDVVTQPAIQPLCLPTDDITDSDYVTRTLHVGGFKLDRNDKTLTKTKSTAVIVSLERCQLIYDGVINLQSSQHICGLVDDTEQSHAGVVPMDIKVVNGKPQYFYLLGILSFFARTEGYPYVYANVVSHLKWIKRNLD